MTRKRLLSGMRPTGPLHLGNYVGALENWVRLQDEYEAFCFVADWHALTTDFESGSDFRENGIQAAIDYLAAGLNPERTTIFLQSSVLEHAELHLLFSMVTPLGWLERVPSYKELQENLGRDINTYGFLGYPVLQTADILVYKAGAVPVGEDQVAHVELTREIARRFNRIYKPIFPEPKALLTATPKLPGTDGRKMSKSYGNTIAIGARPDAVKKAIQTMMTDPARKRRSDAGNPEVCPVFDYHKVFSEEKRLQEVDQGCRTAGIGCVECKNWLFEGHQEKIGPIYERRVHYEQNRAEVLDVLSEGSKRARHVAAETMSEVREAMKLQGRESGG
jgi:tryptophanyl-tRNA synthetase